MSVVEEPRSDDFVEGAGGSNSGMPAPAAEAVPEPAAEPVQYLTVDQAKENAPADLQEEDVEVWGGKVRVRSLTAAQSAAVKQASIDLKGRHPDVAWAEMERRQFLYGVIIPKHTKEQVKDLHVSSGVGFKKIVDKIDELSGIDKEELRKAQDEFPAAED